MKKLFALAAMLVTGASVAQAQVVNSTNSTQTTTTTTTQPAQTTTTTVPVQGQPMQSQGTINQTTTTVPAQTTTTVERKSSSTDTYRPATTVNGTDMKGKDKRRKSKVKTDD